MKHNHTSVARPHHSYGLLTAPDPPGGPAVRYGGSTWPVHPRILLWRLEFPLFRRCKKRGRQRIGPGFILWKSTGSMMALSAVTVTDGDSVVFPGEATDWKRAATSLSGGWRPADYPVLQASMELWHFDSQEGSDREIPPCGRAVKPITRDVVLGFGVKTVKTGTCRGHCNVL